MRTLIKISVVKEGKIWKTYLTWKGLFRTFVAQTGPNYKSKKKAIEEAEEWLKHKDFFVKSKIFQYKVTKVTVN